jgi:uncharacterized protein DUF5979/prealbumin domain-containing protein
VTVRGPYMGAGLREMGMKTPTRVVTVLFVVLAMLTFGLPAFATTGSSAHFEDADGNLALNGSSPTIDWNSFTPVTWTGSSPYRETSKSPASGDVAGWNLSGLEDASSSSVDSTFAGGVKQDDDCGALSPGNVPNKDDLSRVYMASSTIGGHVYLMLSWVRIPQNSVTASAHVGYEFNQATSGSCAGTLPNGKHLAKRTVGDMLIVYDFEGGSDDPILKLSRWIDSGTCEVGSDSPPCWGTQQNLTSGGFAEGKVYFVDPKDGPVPTIPDALKPSGATDPGNAEFGEAGIDLTDAGIFSQGQCTTFGSAYAVSRSSGDSSNAAMEDIVGPGGFSLANCATVNITKSGSDNTVSTQTGAVFTLYEGSDTSGTVVGTCTVDAAGQCGSTPSFSDLAPGTYTVDETTVPANYTKPATLPDTFTLVAGQHKTLSYEDPFVPATVNITKTGSDGGSQTGAVFTLYEGSDTSGTVVGTCTVDAAGQCGSTPSFSDLAPGTYTVDETTVPAKYTKPAGLPDTFTLVVGQNKTLTYDDLVKPGSLEIVKVAPAAGQNDTFTFNVDCGNGNVYTLQITGSGSASQGNIPAGSVCTISEQTPSGYGTPAYDPSNQVTVGAAEDVSVTVTNTLLPLKIQIVKTANPISGAPGDTVTYTYDVTNIGKVDLINVNVTDDKLGVIGTIASLTVGQTKTLTKSTKLSSTAGLLVNVGTAVGHDRLGRTTSDTDDAVVTVVLAILPKTGTDVRTPFEASFAFLGIGLMLIAFARRRRPLLAEDDEAQM